MTACSDPNAVASSTDIATIPAATAPAAPSVSAATIPADASLVGTIVIDGSSTVFPITEAITSQFQQQAPNVHVQLGVSGSGAGFKKFCLGELTIADASRPISSEEIQQCAANTIEFIELPVAFDGISVVVNNSNTWVECVTTDELKRMWEPAAEKTITRWKQIRPGWPDEELKLEGPGVDSGTYDYFTSAVVGTEHLSRSDYTGSEDDYLIVQDIISNRYALGFFGYAYYREFQDQLKVLAIDAGHGCVKPNEQTIADGSYQPLARPLFIYVRKDALARPEVSTFVETYLAHASQAVANVKYVPLTPNVAALVRARAQQQKTGSVFGGKLQIGVSIEQLLNLEENR
ncbi:PstS family phosphate ABC transporter substrate-binding protein [Chloroflexia bacterium SDU3-3]|nr:PstS family phosphate ABC transporter substrate-binding protein [Chloroflexia bacterium SDU3-3]